MLLFSLRGNFCTTTAYTSLSTDLSVHRHPNEIQASSFLWPKWKVIKPDDLLARLGELQLASGYAAVYAEVVWRERARRQRFPFFLNGVSSIDDGLDSVFEVRRRRGWMSRSGEFFKARKADLGGWNSTQIDSTYRRLRTKCSLMRTKVWSC